MLYFPFQAFIIHIKKCEIELTLIKHYDCVYENNEPHLPANTCTFTLLLFALLGEHVYWPESDALALCIKRYDVVTSAFSVMTLTPPRSESKLISCVYFVYVQRVARKKNIKKTRWNIVNINEIEGRTEQYLLRRNFPFLQSL